MEAFINWLYATEPGRAVAPLLLESRYLHRCVERYADSPWSRPLIARLARAYRIDLAETGRPLSDFRSLNDFFTRELRPGCRPIDPAPDVLVAPGDARLSLVVPIRQDRRLRVKGAEVPLAELLQDGAAAAAYEGGSAAIFRLYVPDCHRLYFPCDGVPSAPRAIDGHYYSVSPRPGNDAGFYVRNRRWVTRFDTERFGPLLLVDIGGFLISSVRFSYVPGARVRKGDEKSVFRFGGSTLIVLATRDAVRYRKELVAAASEVPVRFGEPLGRSVTIP